jgi:hypothetical protein
MRMGMLSAMKLQEIVREAFGLSESVRAELVLALLNHAPRVLESISQRRKCFGATRSWNLAAWSR